MQGSGTMTDQSSLAQSHAYATLVVKDYARARRFYSETLGVQVQDVPDMEGMGLVMLADGTGFQLYQNENLPTPQNTVLTFTARDFDRTFQELKGRGVKFEDYDLPGQGIKTTNGMAEYGGVKSAWFKDSEGNVLNLVSEWM
jgi:predicted enzyme related to lactoylglutathione lyase